MVRTPLRVSLFGGGTDIESFWRVEEGQVLSYAIKKYIYTIVKINNINKIRLFLESVEHFNNANEIKHDIIRECLKYFNIEYGVDIYVVSDVVSTGTGLGSSSTLTVGLLNALAIYKGIVIESEELARIACEIEINTLKKPIGKQDQYIAALGGIKKFTFHVNGSVSYKNINVSGETINNLEKSFVLLYSGVKRNSAEILEEVKSNKQKNYLILKKMKEQVEEGTRALERGNINKLPELINCAWDFKKELSNRICNQDINNIIIKAKENGASGVKILGAGGGGFCLIFSDIDKQSEIIKALDSYEYFNTSIDFDGTKVLYK